MLIWIQSRPSVMLTVLIEQGNSTLAATPKKLYSLVLFDMVEIYEFLLSKVGIGTNIPDLDVPLLGSLPLGY